MKYSIIDLFSGAGGLSLGFNQTGRVTIVAAAENNPNARKTYKRNFKVERVYPDVRTINYQELEEAVNQIDIVIGGPPCQGFSNANRQHSTIVSLNNRLVKEYVRAIRELNPKAFVMENVAMLRSDVHRFFVEETEDADELNLKIREDTIELFPEMESIHTISISDGIGGLSWSDSFYKDINLLLRYKINRSKFDDTLDKHWKKLGAQLQEIVSVADAIEIPTEFQLIDQAMAKAILEYQETRIDSAFQKAVSNIDCAITIQKGRKRIKELKDNDIRVYGTEVQEGKWVAKVKSYAVRDYINALLIQDYHLTESTLNAADYGAPQLRERCIIVGIRRDLNVNYSVPAARFTTQTYRTVRDAISDLQEESPSKAMTTGYCELKPMANLSDLQKELRGRLLYNHVVTDTREEAQKRFEYLKEGQNFHDLPQELTTTYSDKGRTQNTIYKKLKYDEPSDTVVNVRKSMWIHPQKARAISIREAARLQTFPDSFIFEGSKDSQYQQVGNAVPPFLAKAIAESVISALDKSK